jgi:alpha-beta hydrolase superfamily lysophospholipase
MPDAAAHLHFTRAPADPRAVVLVLHGGREVSDQPTMPTQLAVIRMIPFARRIAREGGGRLAVARLRYRVRGWNGDLESPVPDARWALDRLAERYPGRPIGLVGHSMGGRTALRVGGHSAVHSIAALAPWLPRGEPVEQLAGRSVLLVHGSADRMTSPKGSAAFAAQLRAAGIDAGLIDIPGEKHAMLGRPRLWHELASAAMLETLLGQSGTGTASNLLRQVSAGSPRVSAP